MTEGIDDVIRRTTSNLKQPHHSSGGCRPGNVVIPQNTRVQESPCDPRNLDSQFAAGGNGTYGSGGRQNNPSSGGSRQGRPINEQEWSRTYGYGSPPPDRHHMSSNQFAAGGNGTYGSGGRQNNPSSGGSRQGRPINEQEWSRTYGYGSPPPDRHHTSSNEFGAGGNGTYGRSVDVPDVGHAVNQMYSLNDPAFLDYSDNLDKALWSILSNRSSSFMSPYGTPSKRYHGRQNSANGIFLPLWVSFCGRNAWKSEFGGTICLSARRKASCDKEVCELFMNRISFRGHLPGRLREVLNMMLDDLQECIRLRKIRHDEIRQARQLECAREKKPYVMSDQGIAHREFYEHLEYIHQLITQLMSKMS